MQLWLSTDASENLLLNWSRVAALAVARTSTAVSRLSAESRPAQEQTMAVMGWAHQQHPSILWLQEAHRNTHHLAKPQPQLQHSCSTAFALTLRLLRVLLHDRHW